MLPMFHLNPVMVLVHYPSALRLFYSISEQLLKLNFHLVTSSLIFSILGITWLIYNRLRQQLHREMLIANVPFDAAGRFYYPISSRIQNWNRYRIVRKQERQKKAEEVVEKVVFTSPGIQNKKDDKPVDKKDSKLSFPVPKMQKMDEERLEKNQETIQPKKSAGAKLYKTRSTQDSEE